MKDQNKDFGNKWSILKKSSAYSIISKLCNFYVLVKLVISNLKEKDRLLNKRFENKYILNIYNKINI